MQATELVVDWTLLTPGETVVVTDANGTHHSGAVDVVAPDGSIFWVYSMFGRCLFARAEQYEVWRTP
ncbi:hypothetical protein ACFRAU_03390 [Arthrobacter sp. NPDC056691]|uniref:hypothetical protein n=1 Tax=Arthrobacter sp. NPDC056691 TaxID=3345913 RepID=UPI00366DA658